GRADASRSRGACPTSTAGQPHSLPTARRSTIVPAIEPESVVRSPPSPDQSLRLAGGCHSPRRSCEADLHRSAPDVPAAHFVGRAGSRSAVLAGGSRGSHHG